MTLDEYAKGKWTASGKWRVMVKEHKTKIEYGPAEVLIRQENKALCDTYINIIWQNIPGKKAPKVFVSWSGASLSLFPEDRQASTKLIQKRMVTYFYENHPEMKEKLAKLMKHKPETAQKAERWSVRSSKEKWSGGQKCRNWLFKWWLFWWSRLCRVRIRIRIFSS